MLRIAQQRLSTFGASSSRHPSSRNAAAAATTATVRYQQQRGGKRTGPSQPTPCFLSTAASMSSSSASSSSSLSSSYSSSSNQDPPALRKVLIANRGEIACRVIRTCRKWGIPTVAIYSNADGPNALHAAMADEAYRIGTGPTPTESYLLQNDVLEIALQAGVDAIHPGYGFLSENAIFTRRVQEAGIRFVGPPARAMQAMGSKSHSKAIMEQAGVPTTPGYYGDEHQHVDFLLQQAQQIGFPVLIKAVMGGGGKGMRLVWHEKDFPAALEACQRESQAAFGDAAVLLEKYLVRPRHVEVQVVADSHGNAVYLYERDCSLQRRHQKIIEEAPASDLDPVLRQRLGEMGVRAAQAVGYVNAGTVEFLLDTQQPGQFYFCEMNTRLQVEHPITELITGVDLVEWQLRIAAGERLPLQQADIPCRGHAFEARIYAENPSRQFLPATGTLWHHRPPAAINTGLSNDGVRVDTGLQSGQQVGVYYDPMISKLIVHDESRSAALRKLVHALKNYQIAGVPTNIDFLIQCAQHPVFGQAGAVNTGFIDDHMQEVLKLSSDQAVKPTPSPLAQTVGACAILLYLEQRVGGVDVLPNKRQPQPVGPWSQRSGSWRIGGDLGRAVRTMRLTETGEELRCVCNHDGSYNVHVVVPANKDDKTSGKSKEGVVYHVQGTLQADGQMQVTVNGHQRIQLMAALNVTDEVIRVKLWPSNLSNDYAWELNVEHPLMPQRSDAATAAALGGAGTGIVKSPMPGRVRRVLYQVGDVVKAGQVVLVMEAMKMEHAIAAPQDGVLTEIRAQVDDVVQDGAILLVVTAGAGSDAAAADSTRTTAVA